jgi:broad specificity phosphatase PhoE
VNTTLILVRNGDSEWSAERRVAGRRELGLSPDGLAQAKRAAQALAELELAEVLSSPLPRAVQTAEAIATPHDVDVARDPRLIDFDAGEWEGRSYEQIAASDPYRALAADPLAGGVPGGEALLQVRDRMVASLDQALADNELGARVAIVSHSGPLRVVIAHYLGLDLRSFHRLRLAPAAFTILRFDSEHRPPRLLGLNVGPLEVAALLR